MHFLYSLIFCATIYCGHVLTLTFEKKSDVNLLLIHVKNTQRDFKKTNEIFIKND